MDIKPLYVSRKELTSHKSGPLNLYTDKNCTQRATVADYWNATKGDRYYYKYGN